MVHGGDFFRDTQRVRQRQHRDRGADANATRSRGHEAGERDRRGLDGTPGVEVDLAEPDAVESPGLGSIGELERFLKRGRLAGVAPPLLDEDPELHAGHDPGALRARKSLKPSRGWAEVSQVARAVSSLS